MHLPSANETVNVADLVQLNEALRKSGNIGYQTGADTTDGSLSPLVPQSIEGSLSSASHTMQELSLWKNIPKRNVTQTLHEYVVVNEHGFDLDPFIGEGGGGNDDFATNQSQYERKTVKIKYMAERRQISDVASLVGLIGDNRQALAEETMRGTMNLMRKVERQLWYGDEDLHELGFDGICKQIKAGGPAGRGPNTFDLAGSAPTPLLLQEVLGEVYSAPNFGRPDCIYVEPRVHSELIKQSVESGRHDQFQVNQNSQGLTFGASNLSIMAPYGAVQVKAAPFLHYASRMPATAFGAGGAALPVVTTQPNAAGTSGKFTAADAGDYIYYAIAVNSKGYSAPLALTAVTVADTQTVTFVLTAHATASYFRIYRTQKDGALATAKLIKEIPNVPGVATTITDLNDGADGSKYNTSKIVLAQHDPSVFEFVRLLDFLRRPLAEVATVKPFLLMLFGAPVVKVPSKMFLLENVGINSTENLNPNFTSANF